VRRDRIPWVVAVVLLVVATVVVVGVARPLVFGPRAFVQAYLDALQRGDTAGALALPGVRIPSVRTDLLSVSGLTGAGGGARILGERADGDVTVVTVGWRHTGADQRTELRVRPDAAIAGVIPQWRFAQSPIAQVRFDIAGGTAVRVGGHRVDQASKQAGTPAGSGFALLVPGAWRLDLADEMLAAQAPDLVLSQPGAATTRDVTLEPTPKFTAAVTAAVKTVLAGCAAQTVLYPPGCPFGERVTDRLASTPAWSIVTEPRIRLSPTSTPGAWTTAPGDGTAHLTVKVRSIFDGKVSDLDQDVPFVASWDVRLDGTKVTLGALRDSGG
jgi:hypothetical protein